MDGEEAVGRGVNGEHVRREGRGKRARTVELEMYKYPHALTAPPNYRASKPPPSPGEYGAENVWPEDHRSPLHPK